MVHQYVNVLSSKSLWNTLSAVLSSSQLLQTFFAKATFRTFSINCRISHSILSAFLQQKAPVIDVFLMITGDNSTAVMAVEKSDLALAESSLTSLFSTEARHAQRDNYFDLNSGNPNDVAPLDFPGPAFDVTPAGLRQSASNLNEPSTPIDTSDESDAVEISGVGRPTAPNPPAFKPQGVG